MATARNLISRAMRILGALGDGETPTTSEAADGLTALNSMLDSWSTEKLMVYDVAMTPYAWNAGVTSRTIGIGGNYNVARPIKIDNAYFTIDGRDVGVSITRDRVYYDALGDKTVSGTPAFLFLDESFPLTSLYVYPQPDVNATLNLGAWVPLPAFTLDQTVSLPGGYERTIVYNLAPEIGAEFGLEIPAMVVQIAAASKANIKRMNTVVPTARIDFTRGSGYNIEAG